MKIMKTFLTAVLLVVTCSVAMATDPYEFFGGKNVKLDGLLTKLGGKAATGDNVYEFTLTQKLIKPLKGVDVGEGGFFERNSKVLVTRLKDLYTQLETAAGDEQKLRGWFAQQQDDRKIKLSFKKTNEDAIRALTQSIEATVAALGEKHMLPWQSRAELAKQAEAHKTALDMKKAAAHETAGGELINKFIKGASKFKAAETTTAFEALKLKSFTAKNLQAVDAAKLSDAILGAFEQVLGEVTDNEATIADLRRKLAQRQEENKRVQEAAARAPSKSLVTTAASYVARGIPSASTASGSTTGKTDPDEGFGLFD